MELQCSNEPCPNVKIAVGARQNNSPVSYYTHLWFCQESLNTVCCRYRLLMLYPVIVISLLHNICKTYKFSQFDVLLFSCYGKLGAHAVSGTGSKQPTSGHCPSFST